MDLRNSFIFFSSYYDAISKLPPEEQGAIYKAIIEYAENNQISTVEISDFEAINGLGLKAKFQNDTYYIGNYNFTKELNIENDSAKNMMDFLINQAKIPLIVIKNSEICAIIAVKDNIKTNSINAISILKQMEIKTIMLSGDNQITANIVAKQVGVDEVYAEVKPDEKLKIINDLKTDNKNLVAMVGDGVNDAPALSTADLSIAIGAGSEIAIDSSDIILKRNDLLDVVNIIKLSKRVLKTIKLGLFWAFFYNVICILVSTGSFYYGFGFKINPMIGTIAMSFSSVSVVLNALTINLFKPIQAQKNKKLYTGDVENQLENFANYSENECKIDQIETNFIKNKEKGDKTMEFYVKGMMCQNCQKHVKTVLENSGVKVIEVNLENKKVTVDTSKTKADIFAILAEAGYDATEE